MFYNLTNACSHIFGTSIVGLDSLSELIQNSLRALKKSLEASGDAKKNDDSCISLAEFIQLCQDSLIISKYLDALLAMCLHPQVRTSIPSPPPPIYDAQL